MLRAKTWIMNPADYKLLLLWLLLLCLPLWGQNDLAILKIAEPTPDKIDLLEPESSALVLPFELRRNLIWVTATVNQQSGSFILDTGAPTLLLNNHGEQAEPSIYGIGSGGSVALQKEKVASFQLAGVEHGNQPAYRVDLSGIAERAQADVLGMIGHKQLRNYELLIDYANEEVHLLSSSKTEKSLKPRFSIPFTYQGHLPIITLRHGKKKYHFAIDTGAGSNLFHRDGAAELPTIIKLTGESIRIQGLDGRQNNRVIGQVNGFSMAGEPLPTTPFVITDLNHLHSNSGKQIDGILGTDFLKNYRISINFRKRRIHIW